MKHSPHIFNKILKEDLANLPEKLSSTVLQYVDDLIVCSASLEQCHKDSQTVLTLLAERGHNVSKQKLQLCSSQVEYLRPVIQQGKKSISPSQLEGVSKASKPVTVRQMMTFLGMTG